MIEREAGFYWVKVCGEWQIAEWKTTPYSYGEYDFHLADQESYSTEQITEVHEIRIKYPYEK